MKKHELVKAVSEETTYMQKDVDEIITATFEVIAREMVENSSEILIPSFGKFSVGVRAARKGRNPQTGKTIQIPEKRVCKFYPRKAFKDALNAE